MPQQSPSRAVGPVDHLLSDLAERIAATLAFFRVPPQDGEDLVQDTCLALVTKGGEINSPEQWFLQTLRNQCASYWRRRRRWLYEEIGEALQADDRLAVDDASTRNSLRHDLHRAIAKLPPRCQSLFRLRYGLGCQTAEMAERLGYRENSVRKAEMRCLSALTREVVGPEPVGSSSL